MKWMLTVLLLAAAERSAAQDDQAIVKALKGVWVKVTNHQDTLKFWPGRDLEHTFELYLGNGKRPPQFPEGAYEFRTIMSVMLVHWKLSSNSVDCPAVRFFLDKSMTNMKIENFYNADGEGKYLTFKKIK